MLPVLASPGALPCVFEQALFSKTARRVWRLKKLLNVPYIKNQNKTCVTRDLSRGRGPRVRSPDETEL